VDARGRLGRGPEQSLPLPVADTLRLVGNLALGVATVAALARGDGQRWAELADRLRRAELVAFELRFPGYPHPNLLAALQLGLDYLDPADRERYRELAVFAGRGAVPRPAVEALWAPAGLSATDAGDLLARFGDRALLRHDPVTGRLDLHDLQFDVARADLGDSLSAVHDQLLAGYAARCPRGWPSGPDDGYFYRHLAGHLAAAGRWDELTELCARSGPQRGRADRGQRRRRRHGAGVGPGRDRRAPGAHRPRRPGERSGPQRGRADRGQRQQSHGAGVGPGQLSCRSPDAIMCTYRCGSRGSMRSHSQAAMPEFAEP